MILYDLKGADQRTILQKKDPSFSNNNLGHQNINGDIPLICVLQFDYIRGEILLTLDISDLYRPNSRRSTINT